MSTTREALIQRLRDVAVTCVTPTKPCRKRAEADVRSWCRHCTQLETADALEAEQAERKRLEAENTTLREQAITERRLRMEDGHSHIQEQIAHREQLDALREREQRLREALEINAERARSIYGRLLARLPITMTDADRSAHVASADELRAIFAAIDAALAPATDLQQSERNTRSWRPAPRTEDRTDDGDTYQGM